MNKMISVASGFQYSVNIAYDLNSDDKLQNFIPTKAALAFIKDILASTNVTSTNRARVLIGAYGKGKSHIVLTTVALLMKKDISLFSKLMQRIAEDPAFLQMVNNYYESDSKLLPVVVTGSNTSLTQAFLLALQRTLSDNDMLDIMPESNYKAAAAVVKRWKVDFPDTYQKFVESVEEDGMHFVDRLESYDNVAYKKFEQIYPSLTAGGIFNPFLGFDVVELYENVSIALKKKGFSGLFVIYDEFSKYLEANIVDASSSDVKMLQDFAEKCNRTGNVQMHLLLISHKEISNYIDKLPKQKVDGWRGVSERFTHVHLNNNFSQTYEIISSVIQKDVKSWNIFCESHREEFTSLKQRYEKHPIFSDAKSNLHTAILGCYPLHPVSTFILPRLSEKVAQNERTLFTFLSSEGNATLSSFLCGHDESQFSLLSPDYIYDYFESLFKKEAFSSSIHSIYVLTATILAKLGSCALESKIIKTISLIYILEQFERLSPTVEEVIGIFSNAYSVDEIQNAIDNLIAKEYVIYLKRSNGFLRLKQTSGIDIQQKISDLVQIQSAKISVKEALNRFNYDSCLYPSRYNSEREMTRFFNLEFIEDNEVASVTNWNLKNDSTCADGVIYAVVPSSEESIRVVSDILLSASVGVHRSIFVIPKRFSEIRTTVRELVAVSTLMEKSSDDPVLFDEYEVVYEDLNEVLKEYINTFTHPEGGKARFIHSGHYVEIRRKAALTELMSSICDQVFSHTPIVNNEAVNKNEITTVAANSRNKIIAALLRNELEVDLGLSGTGQEVSIMRSTLIRTHIWDANNGSPRLNLRTGDANMDNLLSAIEEFILRSRQVEMISFVELYEHLCSAEDGIGLRLGLVPIYLAVVLHKYKQKVIISDVKGQLPINSDVLIQINANPKQFFLSYVEWDQDKEEYLGTLAKAFRDYIIDAETKINSYEYIANAIKRWYLDLPKYSKECKRNAEGVKISKRYLDMIGLLRQNVSAYELLFKKVPETLGFQNGFNAGAADTVVAAKSCYDSLFSVLKSTLIQQTKSKFIIKGMEHQADKMSLPSVCYEWTEQLDSNIFEQMFPNGTEKCISLFRSQTNDEDSFIIRLAKLCTGLRLEDWANDTIAKFHSTLDLYKGTAENFHSTIDKKSTSLTNNYQITYVDENGVAITKRFDRVEYTRRGELLMNQVKSAVNSMGRSISEQEKRQVLMEVLKQLF